MAKKLSPDEVDFRRTRGGSWFSTEWLDGDPWMLVSGDDFPSDTKPETIRARLYNEAMARNLGARSKTLGNGDIVFQAYERTPEEVATAKAATDKRNATRAANLKAGKTKPRGQKAAPATV